MSVSEPDDTESQEAIARELEAERIPNLTPNLMPINPDAARDRALALLARKRSDPESVPYTLAQCEALYQAHKERAERQAEEARMLGEERTLWAGAREDPLAFFADRKRWPAHISTEEAQAQTFFWASRLSLKGTSERAGVVGALHYPNEWPLPVGRRALQQHADDIRRRGMEGYYGQPMALYDAMPFDGDERAGWILETRIGQALVECFGLIAIDEASAAGDEGYAIERMAFRILANGVPPSGVHELCANVHGWWSSLAGMPFRPGRPPGTTYHNLADYEQRFRDATSTLGRPPRSVKEFGDVTGLSPDTVKRNLKRWGTSWGTFRKEQAAR